MSDNTKLFIRQARILLPDGDWLTGDIQVEHGKIAQIAPALTLGNTDSDC